MRREKIPNKYIQLCKMYLFFINLDIDVLFPFRVNT